MYNLAKNSIIIILSAITASTTSGAFVINKVDFGYTSELMDKGGSYYSGHGAILASVSVGLEETGFGLTVAHRQASSGSFSETQRLDYVFSYEGSFLNEQTFSTNFVIKGVYHHMYNSSVLSDALEFELGLSWSNLIPYDFKLYYVLSCEEVLDANVAGFYQVVGIEKSITLPVEDGWDLNFSCEFAHRDGLGGDTVHGWSHATVGLLTSIDLGESLSVNPSIQHQFSFDKAGNDHDVTYASITLAKVF